MQLKSLLRGIVPSRSRPVLPRSYALRYGTLLGASEKDRVEVGCNAHFSRTVYRALVYVFSTRRARIICTYFLFKVRVSS